MTPIDLKTYKNDYGHDRIDCPFCSTPCRAKKGYGANGVPSLTALFTHITAEARKEAFALAIANGGDTVAPTHLNYFKEHTKEGVVVKVGKREFDDNIRIV